MDNPSAQPLVLLDARSSCECLQVLDLPPIVPPRGAVEIDYRYVGTYPGRAETTLTILTDDAKTNREFKVRSETTARRLATLPEPGSIDPRLFRRLPAPVPPTEGVIGLEALRVRQGQSGTAVVDVREPAAFLQGHLPGSLNVPRRQVVTKSFLRSQSLVLLDDGLHLAELQALRAELREAGFAKVEVLDGGLNAWRRAGGKLEGSLDDLSQGNGYRRWLIAPTTVSGSALELGWVLVSGAQQDEARARYFFPHANVIRVPATTDPAEARKAVRGFVGEGSGFRRLLVVSAAGEGYAALENSPWAELPSLPFYLEGGLAAWEKHLQRLTVDQRQFAASRLNPNAGRLILSSGEKAPNGANNLLRQPVPCPTCPGSR